MGDPESDEHLRIFKCLVDTGSGVLRCTVERKMLINTSFEQYLNQNKHKFYHQFEKRRYKPCCSGNPHNCVVNGKMDKKIFFKMYNKKAELDTQGCLDRFEVNADISLDKLDLSDINFFLWNSATLSPQEEQSLKAIMTTRSAICHSSSSREFSLDELENFWLSLKNDLLLFAEPHHYKKSIEREITYLRNCSLSKIESKRVLDKMKKLFHEIKLETEAKNKSIENQMKKGNEGLKNCFRLENNSIKTHMNEKMHEILENCEKGSRTMKRCKKRIKAEVQKEGMKTRLQSRRNRNFLDTKLSDSEKTICQKVKGTKRRMNKMLELTQEEMDQNSKRFKSIQSQQTETEMKIEKTVAQFQTQLSIKVEEEAHETRRQIKMALDSEVHHNRTTTLSKVIEIQSGEGSLKLCQPNEKSDVSSRLLETKREFARNFYTKTAEQKGLAFIFHGDRTTFSHRIDPDTTRLQDFFEEIGFVVKWTEERDWRHVLPYMVDENIYCVFIVLKNYGKYDDEYLIRQFLLEKSIGKPVIVLADFPLAFSLIRDIPLDRLIVMARRQRDPKYKSIFDEFMKVTRSNRFADIIDILTRINSLYDYHVITFQSTLRKKFCFL